MPTLIGTCAGYRWQQASWNWRMSLEAELKREFEVFQFRQYVLNFDEVFWEKKTLYTARIEI